MPTVSAKKPLPKCQNVLPVWKMLVVSNMFHFHPKIWVKWSNLTSICVSRGWFLHHQPDGHFSYSNCSGGLHLGKVDLLRSGVDLFLTHFGQNSFMELLWLISRYEKGKKIMRTCSKRNEGNTSIKHVTCEKTIRVFPCQLTADPVCCFNDPVCFNQNCAIYDFSKSVKVASTTMLTTLKP